jgi:caa(3)-type oxidase subunit IV
MNVSALCIRPALDRLRDPVVLVWSILVGATLGSWWLGTDPGAGDHTGAGAIVLLVAFVKARLIGLYFMELRRAPTPLRLMFEVWCFAACGTVVGLFLFASTQGVSQR